MADPLRVTFFGEDSGHELIARPLIERIAREERAVISIRTARSRGGIPYALQEFKEYQRLVLRQREVQPDVLVVVIDANTIGPAKRAREIQDRLDPGLSCKLVVGCPDPYVEQWCLCQPAAFGAAMGAAPVRATRQHGDRNGLKRRLEESIAAAGHQVVTTPMEIAPEVVEELDLTPGTTGRKHWPDLLKFSEDLRRAFRT